MARLGRDHEGNRPVSAATTLAKAPREVNPGRQKAGRVATRIGVVVALVLLWQLATSLNPSPFFPTPLAILQRGQTLFFGGPAERLFMTDALTVDTFGTLYRMFAGFLVGATAGLLLGTAVGRSRAVREFSAPIVEFLRSIPATATLPLFIIVLGGDDGMRVAFIAFAITWLVLINTAAGVSSVHRTSIEMGQIFRLSRADILRRIVIPAAMPKIFAGLRIAVTGALLLSVASEFLLATNGIGYQLTATQTRFALLDMWAWIVLLALIGFLVNTLLEMLQDRLLRWDTLARRAG